MCVWVPIYVSTQQLSGGRRGASAAVAAADRRRVGRALGQWRRGLAATTCPGSLSSTLATNAPRLIAEYFKKPNCSFILDFFGFFFFFWKNNLYFAFFVCLLSFFFFEKWFWAAEKKEDDDDDDFFRGPQQQQQAIDFIPLNWRTRAVVSKENGNRRRLHYSDFFCQPFFFFHFIFYFSLEVLRV